VYNEMIPLVPSSRFWTCISCPTGSMRKERMRIGSICSLPARSNPCICIIESRNGTQLSFHASSPLLATNSFKYTYSKVNRYFNFITLLFRLLSFFIFLFFYFFYLFTLFIFRAKGTQFPRADKERNETCLERSRCGLRNWERVCLLGRPH